MEQRTAPAGASVLATQPVTAAIEQGVPGAAFVMRLGTAPGATSLAPPASEPLWLANATVATFGPLDAAAGSWRGSDAVVHHIAP